MREAPGNSCKDRLLTTLKQYGIINGTNTSGNNSNFTSEANNDDETEALLKKFEKRVTPIKGMGR